VSFHDAYLRRTPVDVIFPTPEEAEAWVGEVAGAGDDSDHVDLASFLGLAPVRALLDRSLVADTGGTAESPLGTLAFFTYQALLAADIRHVDEATVRAAVTSRQAQSHRPAWRVGAGYVQLPRNLVWTTPETGARPEPVDGFFWYLPEASGLSLLLVSGLIAGHPQLNVILVQDAPITDAALWESGSMRDEGPDFESTIPGGEQLYSLANMGEALKLTSRLIGLATGEAPAGEAPVAPDPARSWLGYRVVHAKPGD